VDVSRVGSRVQEAGNRHRPCRANRVCWGSSNQFCTFTKVGSVKAADRSSSFFKMRCRHTAAISRSNRPAKPLVRVVSGHSKSPAWGRKWGLQNHPPRGGWFHIRIGLPNKSFNVSGDLKRTGGELRALARSSAVAGSCDFLLGLFSASGATSLSPEAAMPAVHLTIPHARTGRLSSLPGSRTPRAMTRP